MGAAPTTAPPLPGGLTRRLEAIDPRWILVVAMALSVALMVWFAGERSFAIDEWEFVINRPDWTLEELLRPANGHLIAIPLVVYKGLLEIFGADSHTPFALMSILLHLGLVSLVYVLAARRLGAWIALLPALLLLFYGSGWEVMINTAAMQNQFAMIAGLGMLLCLDRPDRRGDVAASLLLFVSLFSFSIGVAFAAGAAVRVLADRFQDGRSLQRLALIAAPLVAYAGWYLWASKYDQSNLQLDAVSSLPSNVFDQLSAIGVGLVGIFRAVDATDGAASSALADGRAAILAFALLALLFVRLRAKPLPGPAAWGALAVFVAYLALIAIGLDETRSPDSSRYVYMGTALLLVASCELLAGIRIARAWLILAVALLTVSLLANVARMRTGGEFLEDESAINQAELAAVDLMRGTIDPSFVIESGLEQQPYPYRDLVFPAAEYYAAADNYGTPALTEPELVASSEEARGIVDALFVAAEEITVAPGAPAGGVGSAPVVVEQTNAEVETRGACIVVRPAAEGPSYLVVEPSPGGIAYESEDPPMLVAVRRYTDGFGVALPATESAGTIAIPVDGSPRPWQLLAEFPEAAELCSIRSPG